MERILHSLQYQSLMEGSMNNRIVSNDFSEKKEIKESVVGVLEIMTKKREQNLLSFLF